MVQDGFKMNFILNRFKPLYIKAFRMSVQEVQDYSLYTLIFIDIIVIRIKNNIIYKELCFYLEPS